MVNMIRIGKHSSNDIVVKDHLSEEFHCVIYFEDGELRLCDQNSRFGTLVNGHKQKLTPLKQGDIVQIGFSKIDWESKCLITQRSAYIGHTIGINTEAEIEKPIEVDEEVISSDDVDSQSVSKNINPARYQLDAKPTLINEWSKNLLERELDYDVSPFHAPAEAQVLDSREPTMAPPSVTDAIDVKPVDLCSDRIVPPENPKAVVASKSTRILHYFALAFIVIAMASLGWLAAYFGQQ
jgi:hypothetical protein